MRLAIFTFGFLGAAVATGGIFLVTAGVVPGVGEAGAEIQPARVAVIDLERIFEHSNEREKLEEEMKAEFESKLSELENMKKEIDRLKKEMDLVRTGSDEYKSLQTQVISKSAVLKVEQESAEGEILKKRETYFARMLGVIKRRVSEYAEDRGLDLVIQRQLTVQRNSPPWESVFYARPGLDITDDIIDLLNRK